MSVDLHRISTGISSGSSRNGFGNIVSFPSVSFPANGSYNSTLNDVEYPIAEGGASVTVASVAYPSQTCDVDVENDGAGGTYTDWTTATDVQYKPYGLWIYTDGTLEPLEVEVPSGSGNNYQGGTYQNSYYHDGAGSSYNAVTNNSPYTYGTEVSTSLRDGFVYFTTAIYGSDWQNGTYTADSYYWDGAVGYYIGTTPTLGSFHAYGTYITNDGNGNYYYWDGNNGYYNEYIP